MQFGLFVFSLIALGTLFSTIPEGLLGSPDMHVTGNNSYQGSFYWYQDHSDAAFPTAWIISLPLWCYKIIILLWALWLASALMVWIRWGWQQLNAHGAWNPSSEIIVKKNVPADTNEASTNTKSSPDSNAQPKDVLRS